MSSKPINVLVWDENPTEAPIEIYPDNIRGAIAGGLRELAGDRLEVRTASLEDPQQGLSAAALNEADVLVWWGHARHDDVSDEAVERIVQRVHQEGLGFIALHSAYYSKPFQRILNCTGHLKGGWREEDHHEEICVCAPHHPIAHGLHDFTLADEEMYAAPFDVPPPTTVVFQSYFRDDDVYFPAGLTWTVGAGITPDFESGTGGGLGQGAGIGRVFYFRPGHETVPTFFNPDVQRVLCNAVFWVAKRSLEADEEA